MQRRFESDPAVQGDAAAPAGADSEGLGVPHARRRAFGGRRVHRCAGKARRRRRSARTRRTPKCSCCRTAATTSWSPMRAAVTAAGGTLRSRAGARTAPATTGAAFCYLRDVDSGEFWSAAHQPTLARADSYEAMFSEGRAEFRRRDLDYETYTEIVVSPEDDIELRRRAHHEPRATCAGPSSSPATAEVVLAPPAADAIQPSFGNLFVQTEIIRARRAILCTRRPRSRRRARALDVPAAGRAAPRTSPTFPTRPTGCGSSGAAARSRRPCALDGTARCPAARARCWIRSSRSAAALRSSRASRRRSTSCPAPAAAAKPASALIEKYQDRHLADRVFDVAWTHSSVMLAQINATAGDAQLYRRLASSVLYANAALRAESGVLHPESPRAIRPVGVRDFRRPADRAAEDRGCRAHRPRAPGASAATPTGA